MAFATGGYAEWVGAGSATHTWSLPNTPTSNDDIIVITYASTENNGPIGAASIPGFTLEASYSSPSNYFGAFSVLSKPSDGTETSLTLTWGTTANYGRGVISYILEGGDVSSLVTAFDDWTASTATFAPASQALTIQVLGINSPSTGDGAFPTGSTVIAEDFSVGSWRGLGAAIAGVNINAFPTATSGSLLTMSFADGTPSWIDGPAVSYTTRASVPVVSLATPAESQQFQSPLSPSNTIPLVFGTDNVVTAEARVPQISASWTDMTGSMDGNGDVDTTFTLSGLDIAGTYTLEVRGTASDANTTVDINTFQVLGIPNPVCSDDVIVVPQDAPANIDPLSNDSNIDPAAVVTIETQPVNGNVVVNP